MQPDQLHSFQTVTIYKAPQKGKGQKLLKEGFQAVDFPYNHPYMDGSCYFAGPNDRSIAEEFNQSYKEGILEVVLTEPCTTSISSHLSIAMMRRTILNELRS